MRHVVAGQKLVFAIAPGEPPAALSDDRARGLHDDPATRAELLGSLADLAAGRQGALAHLDAMDLSELVPLPWGESRSRFF